MTGTEILEAREKRAGIKNGLLAKHPGCILVTVSPNIPGPDKRGAAAQTVFTAAEHETEKLFRNRGIAVREKAFLENAAGFFGVYAVDAEPRDLKSRTVSLETNHPLGRLMDIDIIGADREPVSRTAVGGRRRECFVCGGDAKCCARSGKHTPEALTLAIRGILNGYRSGVIAGAASWALSQELNTKYKPGLVDPVTNGAHSDMDVNTFARSISALEQHFRRMALEALNAGKRISGLFSRLRAIGLAAEEDMLTATGGVNTHKGAIFSLGILCASAGITLATGETLNASEVCRRAGELTRKDILAELRAMSGKTPGTNGERLYISGDHSGARGEAAGGFPSVTAIYADFKRRTTAMPWNEVKLHALLQLMAGVEDTNVLARCGVYGLEYMRRSARIALASGQSADKMLMLDRDFTRRNISPGGCADLLSCLLFLYRMESLRNGGRL